MLQQVNYVLITRCDFEAFARNPHGLMERRFCDPITHYDVASAAQFVHSPYLFNASVGGHTAPPHPAGFPEWHYPGSPAGWSGERLLPHC